VKDQRPSKYIKKNKFTPSTSKIPAEKSAGIFLLFARTFAFAGRLTGK
jgi:hypothetical protein